MDPLALSLARSPELFPLDLYAATDQVTLIRLTEADYERASFLDGRILTPQTPRRAVPWPPLAAAVAEAGLDEGVRYIFHIGHVGSTLLSRLLGAHRRAFSLREPAILRTLAHMRARPYAQTEGADAELPGRLGTILGLLGRTFRPEQHAIVKPTSFVSELAAPILTRPSRPKAIFMYVPAESYLATILGAPNSPKEARLLAASRLERLQARIGREDWCLAALSEGEMVAMSWACEITALRAAAEASPERVLWLDFNCFLEMPDRWLRSAFAHFEIDASNAEIHSILSGAEPRRYAKAPEHGYSAAVRRQILDQARNERADEIGRGIQWLQSAAKRSPIVASALNMC